MTPRLGVAVTLLLVALALASLAVLARAGELVECSVSPRLEQGGFWYWRYVDGRQCWFKAEPGQRRSSDMMRDRLRWPLAPVAAPVPPYVEPDGVLSDTQIDRRPRWELEHRWPK